MKKFLLTLLTIVVVAGVLGGAAFAGYRYGYRQGSNTTSNSDEVVRPFTRGNDFGLNNMPMRNFNNMRPGFHQRFGPHGGMMPFGGGRGFISPIFFLARIAIYAFLIWVAYKLITGWRISFTQTKPQNNLPAEEAPQANDQ